MYDIDFIIPWVDGSDPAWIEEKNQYTAKKIDYSNATNRYRSWDNLQYLFRGIEKYAPWVNKVFFVTWGHLPDWLNVDNPKLRIINHKDYIPEKYLPTFSSHPIELNYNRINELSEHFVLLNDDLFFLRKTNPEDFFVGGKPKDSFIEEAIVPVTFSILPNVRVNNTKVINKYFNKRKVYKEQFSKIFTSMNGKNLVRTLLHLPYSQFVGISTAHISTSHLKSTFDTLWEKEFDILDSTCMNKFRGNNDVNHWLMQNWNLCEGNYVPRKMSFGRMFQIKDDNAELCEYIQKRKGTIVCANDSLPIADFEKAREEINAALNSILPEKSQFER